jgi:hypothetical protein
LCTVESEIWPEALKKIAGMDGQTTALRGEIALGGLRTFKGIVEVLNETRERVTCSDKKHALLEFLTENKTLHTPHCY